MEALAVIICLAATAFCVAMYVNGGDAYYLGLAIFNGGLALFNIGQASR